MRKAISLLMLVTLLPLAGWMEKLACRLVQDKQEAGEPMRLKYFDQRLLKTPPIALAQLV